MKRATQSLYRSYFRTLYLSRLALVAFWAFFVYFVLWSVPWFGIGLSHEDYTPQFMVTMIFAGCCILLGLLSGTLRAVARHKREALVAWTSLYDETTGTHTRAHLYDRLSLECERAARHHGTFALALLKLRLPGDERRRRSGRGDSDFLRSAAGLMQGLTRSSDLVALISSDEFGVLLAGVDATAAVSLAERLRGSLASRLPEIAGDRQRAAGLVVEMGIAVYGEDARTPDALVEAARASTAGGGAAGAASMREAA